MQTEVATSLPWKSVSFDLTPSLCCLCRVVKYLQQPCGSHSSPFCEQVRFLLLHPRSHISIQALTHFKQSNY